MEPISLTVDDVTYEQLAGTIDHSLLKPMLTTEDIIAGCKLASFVGQERYRCCVQCAPYGGAPLAYVVIAVDGEGRRLQQAQGIDQRPTIFAAAGKEVTGEHDPIRGKAIRQRDDAGELF